MSRLVSIAACAILVNPRPNTTREATRTAGPCCCLADCVPTTTVTRNETTAYQQPHTGCAVSSPVSQSSSTSNVYCVKGVGKGQEHSKRVEGCSGCDLCEGGWKRPGAFQEAVVVAICAKGFGKGQEHSKRVEGCSDLCEGGWKRPRTFEERGPRAVSRWLCCAPVSRRWCPEWNVMSLTRCAGTHDRSLCTSVSSHFSHQTVQK